MRYYAIIIMYLEEILILSSFVTAIKRILLYIFTTVTNDDKIRISSRYIIILAQAERQSSHNVIVHLCLRVSSAQIPMSIKHSVSAGTCSMRRNSA